MQPPSSSGSDDPRRKRRRRLRFPVAIAAAGGAAPPYVVSVLAPTCPACSGHVFEVFVEKIGDSVVVKCPNKGEDARRRMDPCRARLRISRVSLTQVAIALVSYEELAELKKAAAG